MEDMDELLKSCAEQPDFLLVWDFCQRVFKFRCELCKEPFDRDILFDIIYDNHMDSHKKARDRDTVDKVEKKHMKSLEDIKDYFAADRQDLFDADEDIKDVLDGDEKEKVKDEFSLDDYKVKCEVNLDLDNIDLDDEMFDSAENFKCDVCEKR